MALTKIVDGVVVELTPEEEAEVLAEWEANEQPPTAEEIEADVQALADDMTAATDRDKALAFLIADIWQQMNPGMTQAEARQAVRDRAVTHLRAIRGA